MIFHRSSSILAAADLVAVSAFGLLLPIFAVFLRDTIPGVTLLNVAVAQAIFLTSKAAFDLLFSTFVHAGNHHKRSWSAVALGYAVMAVVPLGYSLAHNMSHIFLLQIVLGMGVGLVGATWHDLFMASTDSQLHGTVYKIYNTAVAFACAAAAILGGYLAYNFDYQILLYTLSGLAACACIMTLVAAAMSPALKQHRLPRN